MGGVNVTSLCGIDSSQSNSNHDVTLGLSHPANKGLSHLANKGAPKHALTVHKPIDWDSCPSMHCPSCGSCNNLSFHTLTDIQPLSLSFPHTTAISNVSFAPHSCFTFFTSCRLLSFCDCHHLSTFPHFTVLFLLALPILNPPSSARECDGIQLGQPASDG